MPEISFEGNLFAMTLLHLIDIPWWSGLASYAFDCMEAHADMGHKVVMLCQRRSLIFKKAREHGHSVSTFGGRSAWNVPENFLKIGWHSITNRPGFLVSHTGSTHWIAVFWGKVLGIPVIRTRAIAQKVKKGLLNRLVYANTRHVVVASQRLKEEFGEDVLKRLGGQVKILLPPVVPPHFREGEPGHAVFPQNKKVGVVARLDPKKGHWDILKAFQQIQSAEPESELHIAGAEENLPWADLLREASKLGLRNVRYHGFLNSVEVWEFMRSCRIGLIASLGSEEVSRALLEWMSVGRPVVASKVGCISEILEEGKGGSLFNPGDTRALSEKVLAILGNLPLSQKMGEYNLQEFLRHYTQANFKARWHEILYA